MSRPPLVCFSHLRWDYVTQRPNHLMARAARDRTVVVVEEPLVIDGPPRIICEARDGVVIVRPERRDDPGAIHEVRGQLTAYLASVGPQPWLWYYTPAALDWTLPLAASAVIYDCMDDLQAFRGADPALAAQERRLLATADVVFTGGHSLYEVKRARHREVHAFPSSVDVAHFARARAPQADPADQAAIPHPRIGWFGVIDERFDRDLVLGVAAARPDWSLVLLGPVTKIAADEVPQAPNIHLLGMKAYGDLPAYLAGWDVAMMPFADNAATRTISPTKTPEYLAGGRPVVSTPIRDVVEPYGRLGLVRIAATVDAFVAGIEGALTTDVAPTIRAADAFLANRSWDRTWSAMESVVDRVVAPARTRSAALGATLPAVAR